MAAPQPNGTGHDISSLDEPLRRANIKIRGVAFRYGRNVMTHCGELMANDLLKYPNDVAWALLWTEIAMWPNFQGKGKKPVLYAAADPKFHSAPIQTMLGLRAALSRYADADNDTFYVEAEAGHAPYDPNTRRTRVLSPTQWSADEATENIFPIFEFFDRECTCGEETDEVSDPDHLD